MVNAFSPELDMRCDLYSGPCQLLDLHTGGICVRVRNVNTYKTYVHTYIHTNTNTFIQSHTYMHTHTYINTNKHTHTHTFKHTHTYIHTYKQTHIRR